MNPRPRGQGTDIAARTPRALPGNRNISLTVRYRTVLYPIDGNQLARVLVEEGFKLPEQVGAIPRGLSITGTEARRGDLVVRFDADKQTIGVIAQDATVAAKEMVWLEELLRRTFGLDSGELAHYYELVATLTARASKGAMEVWRSHFADHPLLQQISEVLGSPVSPFGFRFASAGDTPNQPDWFDVRIEPYVPNPAHQHFVSVVFRNTRRDVVYDFVERFDDTVRKLVSLVEGR